MSWKKVKVVIFLSKTDLISSDELLKIKSKLNEYQKIGYQYFVDYQDLEQYLQNNIDSDEIWVLAGQSGVGKSTLLNRLKKISVRKLPRYLLLSIEENIRLDRYHYLNMVKVILLIRQVFPQLTCPI